MDEKLFVFGTAVGAVVNPDSVADALRFGGSLAVADFIGRRYITPGQTQSQKTQQASSYQAFFPPRARSYDSATSFVGSCCDGCASGGSGACGGGGASSATMPDVVALAAQGVLAAASYQWLRNQGSSPFAQDRFGTTALVMTGIFMMHRTAHNLNYY